MLGLRRRGSAARGGRAGHVVLVGFVAFQGVEWVWLLGDGLTLTSSHHGAFFFLIIGAHALHAIAALMGLGWVYMQMRADRATTSMVWTAQVFWYFVVGVWPTLYYLVYL